MSRSQHIFFLLCPVFLFSEAKVIFYTILPLTLAIILAVGVNIFYNT